MAESTGKLKNDPLFVGLTRPAMLLGVTYSWCGLNGFFWTLFFINTQQMGMLFGGAIISHLIGLIICSKEPRFFDMMLVIARTFPKCRNRSYHGNTSSYDLY